MLQAPSPAAKPTPATPVTSTPPSAAYTRRRGSTASKEAPRRRARAGRIQTLGPVAAKGVRAACDVAVADAPAVGEKEMRARPNSTTPSTPHVLAGGVTVMSADMAPEIALIPIWPS